MANPDNSQQAVMPTDLAANVLTPDQAAQMLHLHPQTLHRLARLGQIPSRKVGHKRRFYRPALEAWLSGKSSGCQE